MDTPISRYSEIEVKFLTLYCSEDECEGVQLVCEGQLDIPGQEVYKHKCPKCMKDYFTSNKSGVVYLKKGN